MKDSMTENQSAPDNAQSVPGNRRDVRRLAMQVLYQMDVTGIRDRESIIDSLDDFDNPAVREQGTDLALAAWVHHADADTKIAELAPEWPTHRQPPVDRALLRLAYHEITTGHAPVKVAINEAIELAKHYASEQTPAFINGVLDKLAKTIPTPADSEQPHAESAPPNEQTWLDDAKSEE
jgi:transcription antitermination protein NusB